LRAELRHGVAPGLRHKQTSDPVSGRPRPIKAFWLDAILDRITAPRFS